MRKEWVEGVEGAVLRSLVTGATAAPGSLVECTSLLQISRFRNSKGEAELLYVFMIWLAETEPRASHKLSRPALWTRGHTHTHTPVQSKQFSPVFNIPNWRQPIRHSQSFDLAVSSTKFRLKNHAAKSQNENMFLIS